MYTHDSIPQDSEWMKRQLGEAIIAGERAMKSLSDACDKLSSAKKWGIFDMLGGGFIAPALAQAVVDSQNYDVVIGSVHGIMFRGERKSTSKFDFGAADEAAMLEYLDGYMDAVVFIAEKLDVDVLAHLTYILRYINGKYKRNLDWRIQEEKIRRIFRAIIERGIALEINTSCVGSFYDEWLPARELVDLYIEMGGRLFTLGSDAHKSEKIGQGFEAVKTHLREKGIAQLVYFKNRVAHPYAI